MRRRSPRPSRPTPDQQAAYGHAVMGNVQRFRVRIGTVATVYFALVLAVFFLVGRNLTGTASLVYAWALVVTMAVFLGGWPGAWCARSSCCVATTRR